MGGLMKDTSGEPRSDTDIIEARRAIETALVSMKDFSPILVYYPTIIESLNELLERRKIDEI
jgi:predicted component of type VI protein secretion system